MMSLAARPPSKRGVVFLFYTAHENSCKTFVLLLFVSCSPCVLLLLGVMLSVVLRLSPLWAVARDRDGLDLAMGYPGDARQLFTMCLDCLPWF